MKQAFTEGCSYIPFNVVNAVELNDCIVIHHKEYPNESIILSEQSSAIFEQQFREWILNFPDEFCCTDTLIVAIREIDMMHFNENTGEGIFSFEFGSMVRITGYQKDFEAIHALVLEDKQVS